MKCFSCLRIFPTPPFPLGYFSFCQTKRSLWAFTSLQVSCDSRNPVRQLTTGWSKSTHTDGLPSHLRVVITLAFITAPWNTISYETMLDGRAGIWCICRRIVAGRESYVLTVKANRFWEVIYHKITPLYHEYRTRCDTRHTYAAWVCIRFGKRWKSFCNWRFLKRFQLLGDDSELREVKSLGRNLARRLILSLTSEKFSFSRILLTLRRF